jgi:hypothetical protein
MTGAGGTLLFVLQLLSVMSRADRLYSLIIASASDVIVDTIPDRKTEINQYHLSQLIKVYFFSYFVSGVGVELRSLHLAVPSLDCGLHTVSNG